MTSALALLGGPKSIDRPLELFQAMALVAALKDGGYTVQLVELG